MEIINLTRQQPSTINRRTSYAFNIKYFKEIWIFNCFQGCQHMLGEKRIKISQISKIIITELHTENISGLLGLLSSLSLINRTKELHIYSPKGLEQYLKLGKKYSQTKFRYSLYFHILKTGLIINNNIYQVYTFSDKISNKMIFEFLIISKEQYGKFKSNKAGKFYLMAGPLYGQIKKGSCFVLPDGFILKAKNFTEINNPGKKISFTTNQYHKRNSIEISKKSKVLHNYV